MKAVRGTDDKVTILFDYSHFKPLHHLTKKGGWFDSTCGKLISLSAVMLQLREKQIFFNVKNELFCEQVRLFRPRHNLARINVSAARACLPKVTWILVGVVVVFP